MDSLKHIELITLLLDIGIILILSRITAEIGKKIKIPVVIGEIFLGILIGPTVLGTVSPDLFSQLFPVTGPVVISFNAIISLSVILLLFIAGMEVQLSLLIENGKTTLYTSFLGMIIPFVLGFSTAWFYPEIFLITDINHKGIFAVFLGTALAISALPVIARILMDLHLLKTRIGTIIIASATFNDLIGWLMFSVILGFIGKEERISLFYTIIFVLLFGIFMLTIGKKYINKLLPWVQTKMSWPGGVLSLALGICFLCAAFTEYIGIHAILGAFIFGIAFGDSVHLRENAREIIHQFVSNIFAPLFFVSIGLKVNFITNFNLEIVSIVFILACLGKMIGCSLGGILGGLNLKESLAVGAGLNARGAMEIILATLALNYGLINEQIFVALVLMALITSLLSAPIMKIFIDTK